MHVDAAIAHIAANNPEFAVHHAIYTANKNLRDKIQTVNTKPISPPQAIDLLSSHMGGELPKTPPETTHKPSSDSLTGSEDRQVIPIPTISEVIPTTEA